MDHTGIVKQAWRDKEKGIIRTALSGVSPEASAIFLPGLHIREYTEVFAPLGFDPRNLIGLERDQRTFEAIARQKPPFQIFHSTFLGYIKTCDRQFDVISYDSQTFYENLHKDLELIMSRKLLKPKGAFILNVMGARKAAVIEDDGVFLPNQQRTKDAVEDLTVMFRRYGYEWYPVQPFGYNSGRTYMVTITFTHLKHSDDSPAEMAFNLFWEHVGFEPHFASYGGLGLEDLRQKSLKMTRGKDKNLVYDLINRGVKVVLK